MLLQKRHTIGDNYIMLDRGTEWKLIVPHPVLVCVDSLNWRDIGRKMWVDGDLAYDFPPAELGVDKPITISQEEFRKACGNHCFVLKDVIEKEYKKTEVTRKCDCLNSSHDVVCCLCGETGHYKENIYEKIKLEEMK